ncbi:hypothetical protein ABE67_09525 [Cytobacillus firmus]|nr:hypothetical protein [Cytobacillus firmus]
MRILEVFLEKERKTFFKTKKRLNLEFFKIRRMDYTRLIGSIKRTKSTKSKNIGSLGGGSYTIQTDQEIWEEEQNPIARI